MTSSFNGPLSCFLILHEKMLTTVVSPLAANQLRFQSSAAATGKNFWRLAVFALVTGSEPSSAFVKVNFVCSKDASIQPIKSLICKARQLTNRLLDVGETGQVHKFHVFCLALASNVWIFPHLGNCQNRRHLTCTAQDVHV